MLKKKKLSNKKILALHSALFGCENPSERESRQKKRVKQGGHKQYFIQWLSWIKILCIRSKVYLCTAVVLEKKRHIFEDWKVCPLSITTRAPSLYCGYFKGLFCKVANSSAIPMMLAYTQKHLPIIKDPLVIPSFIKWRTSSCKVSGC